MSYSIAIDGPAGAGKSTIAKKIADIRKILYIDTGAMYRACALKALRLGIPLDDDDQVETMLLDTRIYFEGDSIRNQKIMLDGEDVSDIIRTPEISKGASDISALYSVRQAMVSLQREMSADKDVILDGRDIGSYVLPEADLKIFLTASVQERARRRFEQMREKGDMKISIEEIEKDISYRDKNDSTRSIAPLVKAEDAVLLDTTDLTIDQVVNKVISLMDEKCLEK